MPCKPSTPTWMLLIWAIMATSGFVQSQTPELEPVRFEDFFHNCSGNCRRGNCRGHPYNVCGDSRILVDFHDMQFISIQFAIPGGTYG